MTFWIRFSWLLPVNALTGVLLGADIPSKYVCPGNSIAAFENITFESCNANISLSTHPEKESLIAMWSKRNCSIHSDGYMLNVLNVSLDENGTIWIHNIHPWDEAIYIVIIQTIASSFIYSVKILVMVAPTTACKPNILVLKNSPYALLNDSNCGKPVPTVYWKNPSGVLITKDPVLKLTKGMEAGKYYACIESLALTCAINLTSTDYCSTYNIGEDQIKAAIPSSSSSSEVWDMTIVDFILVGIHLVI